MKNKISAFQFAAIGIFLADALFVGLGTASMIELAKQDAWMSPLIALVIGLIPIGILIYIMGYKPESNIFEKNKILFGKWFGHIINFILAVAALFLLVLMLWDNTNFVISIYLVKTPGSFVAGIYALAAAYAVIKGIESIGRTSEVLLYIGVILILLILLPLYSNFSFDELKPSLVDGFKPVIFNTLRYLTYCFVPAFLLTAIPKDTIKDTINFKKLTIISFLAGIIFMFIVFISVPGAMSAKMAVLYRFPEYYVLRKISIGGAINNIENFLSIHWLFNTFIMVTMGIYFLSKYIEYVFKIKKSKTKSISILIIGFLAVILQDYIFKNSVVSLAFMKYVFPLFVSVPIFAITLIIFFRVYIKRRNTKQT